MRRLMGALALAGAVGGCYPTEPGISSDVKFLEVRAGGKTACVLTDKGPTLCWGDNQFGQLGNGTLEPSLVPAPMALSPRFEVIAPGPVSCALDEAGAPFCWGANIGVTDIKDGSPQLRPQAVLTSERFVEVGAGCGLTHDQRALCFDENTAPGFEDARFTDLAAESFSQTFGPGSFFVSLARCGLTTTQELQCPDQWVPPGAPPLRAVDLGSDFACALADDGAPLCWGHLGFFPAPSDTSIGTFESDTLVPLSGERQYTAITVGYRHGCGLDANGFASCWGDNTHGQIGDGTTVHAMRSGVLRPTPVGGGLRFQSIAAGEDFTCGVTLDGALYCWGANDTGQLGNGSTTPSLVPVAVAAADEAT